MNTVTKTILVTGATGGIGQAVCEHLAASGYSLVLAARTEENLKLNCSKLPGNHRHLVVDMSDLASVRRCAEQLTRDGIELDGAVLMPPQIPPTNDCLPPVETWQSILNTSFIGPLEVLKAALTRMTPDLSSGRRAKIVIVSGISSAQVLGHYATSNVVRLAWLAEAKTLAFALGERGIHVNTVSSGGTLTDTYKEKLAGRAEKAGVSFDQRLAEETSNVPLRKYATPNDVAHVIAGLLGPFSDHMTGHNILCDGGFTRSY